LRTLRAQGRKLDAGDSKITARVGLGPTGHGGFGLQVGLDLHAPHLSSAEAAELMARADLRCPYSNATRGNIQVTLSVDGAPSSGPQPEQGQAEGTSS
jgi:lipoyl-dependent peroxiredoxin